MAAGLGTRMKSAVAEAPPSAARPAAWSTGWSRRPRALGPDPLVVVCSPESRDAFDGVDVAVQETPLGTGDARSRLRASARRREGDVLVLSGDTPLLSPELLRALVETHRASGAAATVLSFEPPDPRAVRAHRPRRATAALRAIVEACGRERRGAARSAR